MYAQGKLAEADAEYRQALALDPKNGGAHNNLGNALYLQGKLPEAAAAFRRAIALAPKDDARLHNGLGLVLSAQGKWAEAAAAFRQALRLQEGFADAHCKLGLILRNQGKLREALAELRRGDELGSRRPGWSYPSNEWVRQCQRLLDLEDRLPAILAGKARPAGALEQVEFAELCALRKRYADASRFFADAFATRPELANGLNADHRYKAACCAAQTAAGQGEGTDSSDATERGRWRQRALDWLRADLAAWARVVSEDSSPGRAAAAKKLRYWQQDAELAAVRNGAALAPLPAEECAAWVRLWADAADLLEKAGGQGPPRK
jgi:tetratricopeptide (TPR) repeat protein